MLGRKIQTERLTSVESARASPSGLIFRRTDGDYTREGAEGLPRRVKEHWTLDAHWKESVMPTAHVEGRLYDGSWKARHVCMHLKESAFPSWVDYLNRFQGGFKEPRSPGAGG